MIQQSLSPLLMKTSNLCVFDTNFRQEVNTSPPYQREEVSSPEQTATGKDFANPFTAVNLPKIQ